MSRLRRTGVRRSGRPPRAGVGGSVCRHDPIGWWCS